MKQAYSVSQLNGYIKEMFNQDFLLNNVYVKGEISNCKYHSSGHIYFTLKDEKSAIAAIMFAGNRRNLSFKLEEGQKVIVLGSVSVYERDGRYQIYANQILLDGEGDLHVKFEKLKKELAEMGMFAQEYKRPIKKYIEKLGVVTAPTGAAIRDIINVALRRNPYVSIILYPALVQGEGAKESIVKGIKTLDNYGVDTIIVGRGGGSIEDLWAFNEEVVARAIFDANTPIISAVGHEIDVTIADYVADLRAPTPSAAAELAVFEFSIIEDSLLLWENQLNQLMLDKINNARSSLEGLKVRLDYLSPINQIKEKRQYAMILEDKLSGLMDLKLMNARNALGLYIEKLKGLSPLEKLNSGFSYVANDKGNAITKADQVQIGDVLEVFVSDGNIKAEVKEISKVRRS